MSVLVCPLPIGARQVCYYLATQIDGRVRYQADGLDPAPDLKWSNGSEATGWTIGIALRIRRLGVRIPPSALVGDVTLPDSGMNSDGGRLDWWFNLPGFADRLNQPDHRIGGPLPMRAILEMPTTDRVRIFAEKFGFGSQERPFQRRAILRLQRERCAAHTVGVDGHGVPNRKQPWEEVLNTLAIDGGLAMCAHSGTVPTGCDGHNVG